MPKGIPNKRYTPEFKKQVVEAVIQDGLSYREAARIYEVQGHGRIESWERIYLEEGPEGLAIERRGRRSTGRPKKLPSKVEEDLLAEVQRLRAENAYLKNLQALVLEEERRQRKNAGSSKTEARILTGPSAHDRSTSPRDLLLPSETDEGSGQIQGSQSRNYHDLS